MDFAEGAIVYVRYLPLRYPSHDHDTSAETIDRTLSRADNLFRLSRKDPAKIDEKHTALTLSSGVCSPMCAHYPPATD